MTAIIWARSSTRTGACWRGTRSHSGSTSRWRWTGRGLGMRITRTGDSSDNHIKSSLFLDNLNDFVIEERAIGANPYFPDRFWQFGEGKLQQRDGYRGDVWVSGTDAAIQIILGV